MGSKVLWARCISCGSNNQPMRLLTVRIRDGNVSQEENQQYELRCQIRTGIPRPSTARLLCLSPPQSLDSSSEIYRQCVTIPSTKLRCRMVYFLNDALVNLTEEASPTQELARGEPQLHDAIALHNRCPWQLSEVFCSFTCRRFFSTVIARYPELFAISQVNSWWTQGPKLTQ